MALEIFRLMGSVFVDTDKATKSLHGVDKTAESFGKRLLGGIGTAAKWAAGVAIAAGTVGIALGKSAIDAYAEYEQLVGGVETLFGESADDVMKYAQNAYKTAGMTANQYMETTTSFAAALLSGLKGDTAAAAKYADMAITDMSDNANKMGTSIESIQNAYQGFAKQNYTMLDNLKLGYGGTQKEMQRLLKDADAINAKQGKITKYSLNNLSDVYEAIHVIQTEMGITGTTAKEATETISGQIGMLKARFENFKTTLGESLAPVVKNILGKLIDNLPTIEGMVGGLATAAVKVVDFAMPYIMTALEFVEKWFAKVPDLMNFMKGKLSDLGGYLSQKFQPVIQTVRDWFDKLRDTAGKVPEKMVVLKDKLLELKDKAIEVGSYMADKFQPTLDNLKAMFEAVKDKLQPFIDKLSDYIKSGEAAKDATQLMKDAGQLLKDAFDAVATAAEWVTEKVIEVSDWCVEHYKTIESIAIVIGSFAAAWGLVNGALAIWNGLATIGAAATGLLSGAATVLGGVIAFLTSPITLVIAAIGAVIAIGVLLWRNWDTVKAKASELWQAVKDKFSQLKEAVSNKVTEMKNAAVNKFNEMKEAVSTAVSNAKQAVSDKFSEMYNSAKEKVTNVYNTVKEKFDAVKNAVNDAIEGAKNVVKNGVQALKDFFNFDWKLPKIKLPHFSISGSFSLNPPSIPKFSVSWYRKAYEQAMILNDPTIFGYSAASGKALGAGDGNGNEVVVGEAHLLRMIDGVVAKNMASAGADAQTTALLQDIRALLEQMTKAGIYLDTGALVGGLAKPMDKKLGQIQAAKARG